MPLAAESRQGTAIRTGAGRKRDRAQRESLIVREQHRAAAHIEPIPRTVTHVLAAGACQVQSEDASDGHLVLRLMGCLVLMSLVSAGVTLTASIHSADPVHELAPATHC